MGPGWLTSEVKALATESILRTHMVGEIRLLKVVLSDFCSCTVTDVYMYTLQVNTLEKIN